MSFDWDKYYDRGRQLYWDAERKNDSRARRFVTAARCVVDAAYARWKWAKDGAAMPAVDVANSLADIANGSRMDEELMMCLTAKLSDHDTDSDAPLIEANVRMMTGEAVELASWVARIVEGCVDVSPARFGQEELYVSYSDSYGGEWRGLCCELTTMPPPSCRTTALRGYEVAGRGFDGRRLLTALRAQIALEGEHGVGSWGENPPQGAVDAYEKARESMLARIFCGNLGDVTQ